MRRRRRRRGESQPPPPQQPERAVDLLRDLPTDVLDKILASLPARDMVRTSVLSPPWHRRWESIPGLDIELHDVRDEGGAWDSAAGFLKRCAAPVGRVSIRGVPLRVYDRANDWVGAVARKSPRSLSLKLPVARKRPRQRLGGRRREEETAPTTGWAPLPSLFSCDPAALAELELRFCRIPAAPADFTGFHRLAKLDLDDVFFTGRNAWVQLEAMVSAAMPTLVELRLQNIYFPAELGVPGGWVIQAPNLRRLVLCLRIAGAGLWELGPLPNLELGRIFLNDSTEDRYVQMFKAISNVRELHIGNFHINKQAAAMNIFKDRLLEFRNLRILRVDGDLSESPTKHLLSLSPLLETVEIKRWY